MSLYRKIWNRIFQPTEMIYEDSVVQIKTSKLAHYPFDDPPRYQTPGSAAVDIYSAESANVYPGDQMLISTGLMLEIPHGYAGLLMPRSGLALKNRVSLGNSVGLIDSDYRGELKVLVKVDKEANNIFIIKKGMRIAQLLILKIPTFCLVEAESLSETIRADGGFGSTGTERRFGILAAA